MNKKKLCRKFNSVWVYLFFPQAWFLTYWYILTLALSIYFILLLVFFLFF